MKQKHLTLEEREFIENKLKENWNFTVIGKEINKHRTTISQKILKHRYKKDFVQYNCTFAKFIYINKYKNTSTKLCKKTYTNLKKGMYFIKLLSICL